MTKHTEERLHKYVLFSEKTLDNVIIILKFNEINRKKKRTKISPLSKIYLYGRKAVRPSSTIRSRSRMPLALFL